jgi:hypothetical protein
LIDLAVEQRRVVLEDDPLAIAVATDGQDRCSPHPGATSPMFAAIQIRL